MLRKMFYLVISIVTLLQLHLFSEKNNSAAQQNILIIIDKSEYAKKVRGPETTAFLCALADAAYPIVISKELLHNGLQQIKRYDESTGLPSKFDTNDLITFISDNFIIKDASPLYVLIPLKMLAGTALQINQLETIVLKEEVENKFPQWLAKNQDAFSTREDVEALKKLFVPNSTVSWNIIMEGHGAQNDMIVGLYGLSFAQLLKFFKNNISINVLFLQSCYALGHTEEIFAYAPMGMDWFEKEHQVENYPFVIIAASIGETPTYNHNIPIKPFPAQCESSLKNLFNVLNQNSSQDYYEIFKNTGMLQKVDVGSLLQIRYKNTEVFVPLTSEAEKTFINITQVMGKTRKEPLNITHETKLIMVYPETVPFPLVFTGNFSLVNHVRIVSMLKSQAQHVIEKIEFKNKPDTKTDQFDLFCALFAPRFVPESAKKFLIKEVVFSKPFNLLGFKNITKLTNAVIEIQRNGLGIKKFERRYVLLKIHITLEEKNGTKRYLEATYLYDPRTSIETAFKGNVSDLYRLAGDMRWQILDTPYSL